MADPVPSGHGGSNGHSNGHAGNGHAGHGGVKYEKTDITTGGLYVFALVLSVIVISAAGGVSLLYDYLRKEADRQNRNIPTLELSVDRKPGDVLPFDGDPNKPVLEGIRGTDPSAPRSGVYGYTTLSAELKKSATEKLSTYGFLGKDHAFAHVPIEEAIKELATSKMLKVREKTPDGIEIGSIVNPYSFYKSDSSSGRTSLGETRK